MEDMFKEEMRDEEVSKKDKIINSKGVKKVGGFISEFKEFISRGSVLDLAVGMIIGTAFTAIVNSLVKDVFTPFIGMILAGVNFQNLGVTIPWGNKPYLNFGNFIQAIITFLITAFCIFIFIKLINAFERKKKAEEEENKAEAPTPEDILLLREIRDLLQKENSK